MILREETRNVMTFMQHSEHPVRLEPTSALSRDEICLRLKLAYEELMELADAVGLGVSFRDYITALIEIEKGKGEIKDFPADQIDLSKVLDALADIQYINRGTALSFGLGEALYDGELEAHESNMTKFDSNGKVVKREDGKVIKGENFREPDFKSIINYYTK